MPKEVKATAVIAGTVTVTADGRVVPATRRGSYRQGFADLLDFASPPTQMAILPRGAPTTIGTVRTGTMLRDAIAAFGKTAFGKTKS
jgi:hypothetical protein